MRTRHVRGFVVMLMAMAVTPAAGCGDGGATGTGGQAPESGSIVVQIGGEDFGPEGFQFPTGSEVVLSDGWELHFDHVLVTIGRVWLSEGPDTSPSDQSVVGDTVAELAGPFAVDLAKVGDAIGAGGEGTAISLGTIDNQNLNGGSAFDATARYALSFDVVPAVGSALHVNFADDDGAKAAYASMVTAGYTVMYAGTATWKGTTCNSGDAAYDFAAIPTSFDFEIGFRTPASFINCQNQENQGAPFQGEEFQRGIPMKSNDASLAQLTFHLDHPFFSDVEHEPRLYFDQYAAALVGQPADTVLKLEMLLGVDPTAFVDGSGAPLPWRSCDGTPLPAGAQRSFLTGTIPLGPAQPPASGLRDYVDFVHYVQSSQGHLNGGEGICYTRREYTSPQ